MAPRYAALMRDVAGRAVGAPRELAAERLEAFLDRLSPPGRPRLSDLLGRAKIVGDRAALVRAARDLHRWKTEITRGRR